MKDKSGYAQIKQKVFIKMLAIVSCAAVVVMVLRSLTRGHLADAILAIFMRISNQTLEEADMMYQVVVRNNMSMIIFCTMLIFLLLLIYIFISSFTKYFDEMIRGVDLLVSETKTPIVLQDDLRFMEDKLNHIKGSLEEKTRLAKEAEQRKDNLVVYLAHDIKTPLTSVIGYLNLLNEEKDLPLKQQEKYVGITLEKAYHLEELIGTLFDITRLNHQDTVWERQTLDISFMLHQLVEAFYPQMKAKGQTAAVHAHASILYDGDSDKLGRVFGNILKNAVAYADENSEITITAQEKETSILIAFSNWGETIPPQDLPLLFEKFYRADTSRSTATGGAGLGLAIAKELTQAHGGTLTATSQDRQTTFLVNLRKN